MKQIYKINIIISKTFNEINKIINKINIIISKIFNEINKIVMKKSIIIILLLVKHLMKSIK